MKLYILTLCFIVSTAQAKKCHFAFKCMNNETEQIIYQSSSAKGVAEARKFCAEDKKNLCGRQGNETKITGCVTNSNRDIIDSCAIFVCEYFGFKNSYKLGRDFYSEDEIKEALKKRIGLMEQAGDCKF